MSETTLKEPSTKQRTKYNKCLLKYVQGLSKRNEAMKAHLNTPCAMLNLLVNTDKASEIPWKESAGLMLAMEPAILKQDFKMLMASPTKLPSVMTSMVPCWDTFTEATKGYSWKQLTKLCRIVRGLPTKDASSEESKKKISSDSNKGVKGPAGVSESTHVLNAIPNLQARIAPVLGPIVRDPGFKNMRETIAMMQKNLRAGDVKFPSQADVDSGKVWKDAAEDPKAMEMFSKMGFPNLFAGAGAGAGGGTGDGPGVTEEKGGFFKSIITVATELIALKDEDKNKNASGPTSAETELTPHAQQIKANLEKITLVKQFHATFMAILKEITERRGYLFPVLVDCFCWVRWFLMSGGYVPNEKTDVKEEKEKITIRFEEKHDPLFLIRETVEFFKRNKDAFLKQNSDVFLSPKEPLFVHIKSPALWVTFKEGESGQRMLWQWSSALKSLAHAAWITGGRLRNFEAMAKDILPEICSSFSQAGGGVNGLDILRDPTKMRDLVTTFTQSLRKDNRLFKVKDLVMGLTNIEELDKACDLFNTFMENAEQQAADAPTPATTSSSNNNMSETG